MKFTNAGEKQPIFFEDLGFGEYFRQEDEFYIKTNMKDEDSDFYAVELTTGNAVTMGGYSKVTPINIKEIIYEDD